MIERVARAIFEAEYGVGEAAEFRWERSKDMYLRQARAAIEEMREPTEHMVATGQQAQDEAEGDYSTDYGVKDGYRAMIDEALK